MAQVNNATGVFATLNYNFDDPNGFIEQFSESTQAHMNEMPPFIESWQAQDVASNSVGSYFTNPVKTHVNTIITVSNNIKILANVSANTEESGYTGADLLSLIQACSDLSSSAADFNIHTDKISGVIPFAGQEDAVVNPYYTTAMNYGKTAIYITNQTDGIINTSPIMGSFTSILVAPQIQDNANTLSVDYVTLTSGIASNNLTESQVTEIYNHLTSTNVFLNTRRTSDITYFGNLRALINNYNSLREFSNMGETQKYLLNNFIGTDKLKSRIN
jgi:hypothetical protein